MFKRFYIAGLIFSMCLTGCSAIGYQAERKSNWQTVDAGETDPNTRALIQKKSIAGSNSPMQAGTEIDYLILKKIAGAFKSEPERVEFKDVADCKENQTKVCSALKGCGCSDSTRVR